MPKFQFYTAVYYVVIHPEKTKQKKKKADHKPYRCLTDGLKLLLWKVFFKYFMEICNRG